jgi:chaperone modulatory protein CbpM
MKKIVITSATVVGKSQPLSADDLARACGAEVEWVAQLVEVGIVNASGSGPSEWRFYSVDLQRDAVALILDLSQEVRRLKSQLRALGAMP